MKLDSIKKEFVSFFENIHEGLLFPKNYFGCLIAILIEQKPITQERIEELTNYNRAIISQIIRLIPLNFNLNIIKKPGIRKRYYDFSVSTKEFMVNFFETIIDSYKERPDFLLSLIEKVQPYVKKHERFSNLSNFLKKLFEISKVYLDLYSNSKEDLRSLILKGKTVSTGINEDVVKSPKYQQFLNNLVKPIEIPTTKQQPLSRELLKIYTELKAEFYLKFRENMSTGESQLMNARTIIGTELLLENRPVNQEEIQRTTGFARSLISETLNLLIEWKMITQIKLPNDRKKYYIMNQSWDVRLINRLRANIKYARKVTIEISDFVRRVNDADFNEGKNDFLQFLYELQQVFKGYEHYYQLLEYKYIKNKL